MFLVDEEKLIIHDLSFTQYECKIKEIPQDKRRKIYTLDQVKRMITENSHPRYNGCRWCMPDYHLFDMTKIF